MDFDQLLAQQHHEWLYEHLRKRPHQQGALAKLYFSGSYHITPHSLWKALNSRGLVRDIAGKQPMLDTLTEDGMAFCKWYSRRMTADAEREKWRQDPFKAKELPDGTTQHSLFEDESQ